jgi:protein gp37
MNKTSIEWTTFSANPLKYRDKDGRVVWGCVHASPGCKNCYSEALAKRYGKGGPFNVPTINGLTPFLDKAELHKMLTAKTINGIPVSGARCFVGDMTDIFGEWVPDALLDRLFAVFALRPDVTWQILTKRVERMRDYMTRERPALIAYAMGDLFDGRALGKNRKQIMAVNSALKELEGWPLPNVWLGVSCEDQQRADERIPLLLQTPAAVRWVSAEPLLGPIDLQRYLEGHEDHGTPSSGACTVGGCVSWTPPLDWIVVGGESGHGARPCVVRWIQHAVDQCRDAGIPAFVKQVGAQPFVDDGDLASWPHARFMETDRASEWRVDLRDRKGSDLTEWPIDLRVREYPMESTTP